MKNFKIKKYRNYQKKTKAQTGEIESCININLKKVKREKRKAVKKEI